jgi:hypothetical protein
MVNKDSKKKSNKSKPKAPKASSGKSELAELTRMIKGMKAPSRRTPTLSSILSDAGDVAGRYIPKIFGRGAYSITKNSMFNTATQSQVPVMHSSSEMVTFRHREYICDVSSTASFTVNTYAVNPGLATTFPYLSAIAQNFQEYEFKGLVFEFKSTSANALNSTNTALGTIMMAAQYRADAAAFINKEQLLNEMWSVDSKPSDCFILPIECAPVENPLSVQYVRSAAVPAGQDAKLYDLAQLTVASYGSQATANVGELWCSYEVQLRKPQLTGALDIYGQYAHFYCTATSGPAPLVNPVTIIDTIGLTISASSKTVTLPKGTIGKFYVNWVSYGSSVTLANSNITYTNAVAAGAVACNSSNTYFFSPVNGTATLTWTYSEIFYITDNTKTAILTFGSAGTLPTAAITDVYIMQLALSAV